jgi:hypothetical protein
MALGTLASNAPYFQRARPFAVAGGIASVLTMLPLKPIQPFAIAQTLCEVLLIWLICGGIIHVAARHDNGGLANEASSRRMLYVISAIFNIGAGLLTLIAPRVMVPAFAILLVAFSLAVGVLVLLLLKRASQEAVCA